MYILVIALKDQDSKEVERVYRMILRWEDKKLLHHRHIPAVKKAVEELPNYKPTITSEGLGSVDNVAESPANNDMIMDIGGDDVCISITANENKGQDDTIVGNYRKDEGIVDEGNVMVRHKSEGLDDEDIAVDYEEDVEPSEQQIQHR